MNNDMLTLAAKKYLSTFADHRNNPTNYEALTAWDNATSEFMALVNNDELNIIASLLAGREADKTDNSQLRQRIADLEARPVAPFDFKETTDADYCREWAWRAIKKDLPTEHWKTGENGTFYAFYLMGWHARLQYNEQRRSEYSQIADTILKTRTVSINTEPWRSFVSDDDITALNRFAECCDDPESGGHDLEKEQVKRLEKIGLLRRSGRISFTTDFGDFVLSAAGINLNLEMGEQVCPGLKIVKA
ncbi:TPA: hypothetical protein LVL98_001508 [Klebsiella michiganensis]|jgi:hypothetical protein|uniref:hypothetical protein n=1 Tax=Enterobacteriaceae TaxID=543 RepID=UPI0008633DDB|nr:MULTISPECIES: hypothetical protein [Enterobacteriaceae]AUU88968.1 hypothetical protein C2U55_07675 [Enterobacteriaceae bacterium ENNIH3]ELD7981784.1 hypothetical protein [Enterobacter hormaechei]MDU4295259.1 hypothetical protein [Enterobacter asburiae]HBM3127800.1 hypothetical protein [Klebsiella michiganensis]HCD7313956.1 hypothetical protein [Enterobacter chengduensis]HED1379759.1 hypothetical protein [Enterobacter hormaechei subsp. steigerwaltii]